MVAETKDMTQTTAIKIGVTGATGLVGRDLVQSLSQAGFSVRALARKPLTQVKWASELAMQNPSLEWFEADISDNLMLADAFKGLDVVVHAAGFVDPLAPRSEIFAINFEGTKNCFVAATACGVKQFIHVSSLSVITGQGDQYNLDESAPLTMCGESYADSKVAAERYITGQTLDDIKWTVVRPGFIYGPGERSWLPRVIDNIAQGKAVLVDGGSRETNVVYVGNLTLAIRACLLNSTAYGQVFNITDGQKVTKKELFDSIADGMNLPRVSKNVPRWVLKPVFDTIGLIAPLAGSEGRSKLAKFSPGAFRLVAVNQGFSVKKAERLLAYDASNGRQPFKESMVTTLQAIKKDGAS